MQIRLNGEPYRVPSGETIEGLLQILALRADQVAVEHNLDIVDRGDFATRVLQEGDQVEILSFIGGGTSVGERGDENIM
ncbi:MAG: sulfur carrier protein ThiS [Nitrospirae bacterium]|nr:MAG: sulfur carrier protein ThiS [Nitrospirota bacterium]